MRIEHSARALLQGVVERSSTTHPNGAVLRYDGVFSVEYTGEELGRLVALRVKHWRDGLMEAPAAAVRLTSIRKVCACCGEAKPVSAFYSGRRSYCSACMREHRMDRHWNGNGNGHAQHADHGSNGNGRAR